MPDTRSKIRVFAVAVALFSVSSIVCLAQGGAIANIPDDLLKAVLLHRPDRIIVGEVRGPEARTLLDAMNTGHRGTLATIHASSADESIRRLASLAIRGSSNLQLSVAEEDVLRCIHLIVYISRHQGNRRVKDVIRVQKPA